MFDHFSKHLRELWLRFIEQRDRPHSMAGGLGIGIFFGFFPPFGFKTLVAMGAAWLTGSNMVAAVVGVTLHDLYFWMWPLLWRLEFQVGRWILSHPHAFAPKIVRTDFRMSEIMQWNNFVDVGLPLLVGTIAIALPITLVAYGLTLLWMLQRERARCKKN